MVEPGNASPPSLRTPLLRTGLLVAALALGATATVTEGGATWFGVRGPRCPLGACCGEAACPGCGLLRSTAAALQGDFAFAWAAHPAGPVVAGLLVAATLLHFDILRRRHELPTHRRLRRGGQWAFTLALAAAWLYRLLRT